MISWRLSPKASSGPKAPERPGLPKSAALFSPFVPEGPSRFVPAETSGMFRILARFTAAHPYFLCAAWIVAGMVLSLLAPAWDARTVDDDIRFLPDRFPSGCGCHPL